MAYDTWGGSWAGSWGLSWTRADVQPVKRKGSGDSRWIKKRVDAAEQYEKNQQALILILMS